jgi:hypothetical protein
MVSFLASFMLARGDNAATTLLRRDRPDFHNSSR